MLHLEWTLSHGPSWASSASLLLRYGRAHRGAVQNEAEVQDGPRSHCLFTGYSSSLKCVSAEISQPRRLEQREEDVLLLGRALEPGSLGLSPSFSRKVAGGSSQNVPEDNVRNEAPLWACWGSWGPLHVG